MGPLSWEAFWIFREACLMPGLPPSGLQHMAVTGTSGHAAQSFCQSSRYTAIWLSSVSMANRSMEGDQQASTTW